MNLSSSIQKMLLLLALSLAGCSQQKAPVPLPLEITASPEPHPETLIIAPEFQQIGNSVDGGGILRVMIGTMAMLSTNEAEQERLANLSNQPDLSPLQPPETVDLSEIGKWLTPGELPDAAQASQTRTFGAWKFLRWGEGLGETTVALYRNNGLQFAWQGYGMATTGEAQNKNPKDDPYTWFEGPPAGTDLDRDGVPDLLIYDYSGGAHCCYTVRHIVCSDPPMLTAQISGWDSEPSYRDLDGDGRYEMIIGDASYAYWNACYAASPLPQVIFRIRQGHYEIAEDLMRSNAPAAAISEVAIGKLHRQLSRYDLRNARHQTNQNEEIKLTAEEEADDDFFFGQAWRADGVCIPPVVWDLLLNLIYTGQIDPAVKVLDTLWPAGKGHKAEFANDLLDMIHGSWYGRHLPWFNELEQAFARSFPLTTAVSPYKPPDLP